MMTDFDDWAHTQKRWTKKRASEVNVHIYVCGFSVQFRIHPHKQRILGSS